jgi:glycosyltransferase involved in cell wall biosynthesis
MEDRAVFKPRISVALVTRNRPDSLLRTLRSLIQQDMQPMEVIVSDDSDEGTADEVKKIVQGHGFRYLRGPRRGLYANRNHVALACSGTHIRTMDDDHEFPAHHFQSCVDALQKDPDSVWIIGEFLPDETPGAPLCPGQLHPRGFSTAPPDSNDSWAISDGASLYPIGIFQQGIRYAEYFKFGAAYLEFGSRLHYLGYRIRFLPSTYVIHHYEANSRSFMDSESDRSSRFFATICHSYIYQPTLRNKALCSLEIIRQVVTRSAYASLRPAISAYRDHSLVVSALREKGPSSQLQAEAGIRKA